MDRKKSTSVSYSEVGMLSKITRDYLDGKEGVKPFYDLESNSNNIEKVIGQKSNFPMENRITLVNVLQDQYKNLKGSFVKNNIELLLSESTYTITTGHQLNLFTGPLYFIYKIISAIKTAKQLALDYPDNNFVPIYWMATEDHDFDEINHTYLDGNKIQWKSKQTGMVGEFSLDGIEDTVIEFCNALGDSLASKEMKVLIHQAYLEHSNLADAMRFLVHELFQNYGLVIMDANQKDLKRLFIPIVKQELSEQTSFKSVSNTIKQFGEEYSAQVSPRECNLFYVVPGVRERIIKSEKGYSINNSELTFDSHQMEIELENHPERFSPNVILRPVYQEVILPNLVYIGGGAEVAYWLELKSTFEAFNVPFPFVQIRSSFLTLSGKNMERIQELNWTTQDLYRKKNDLLDRFSKSVNPFEKELVSLKSTLVGELNKMGSTLTDYDEGLQKSISVSQAGIEKSISRLEKKVSGAVKRMHVQETIKMDQVLEAVNPNGVYQERQVNFFEMYGRYGASFLDHIFDETEPFTASFRVLKI